MDGSIDSYKWTNLQSRQIHKHTKPSYDYQKKNAGGEGLFKSLELTYAH